MVSFLLAYPFSQIYFSSTWYSGEACFEISWTIKKIKKKKKMKFLEPYAEKNCCA